MPYVFNSFRINLCDNYFFFISRCLCNNHSLRIADKRLTPKFNSGGFIIYFFQTNSVHCCNIDSVCDSVSSLNCEPRLVLCSSVFFFFIRVPADCRWIKKNSSSLKCSQSCSFRIPLIPANQCTDSTE